MAFKQTLLFLGGARAFSSLTTYTAAVNSILFACKLNFSFKWSWVWRFFRCNGYQAIVPDVLSMNYSIRCGIEMFVDEMARLSRFCCCGWSWIPKSVPISVDLGYYPNTNELDYYRSHNFNKIWCKWKCEIGAQKERGEKKKRAKISLVYAHMWQH